jgi:uncharacterized membrane protein
MLAALFGTSGIVHLVRPKTFIDLIPKWIPGPRGVIYVSGVAELICAVGLVQRSRWARAASVLVLVAVFPGNIQMAVTAASGRQDRLTWPQILTLARLPLQLVLIWAALQTEPSSHLRPGLAPPRRLDLATGVSSRASVGGRM